MYKEIDLNDFIREFKEYDRDKYSREAYEALFEYYDEFDEELDVIYIACTWSEYSEDDLICDYGHMYSVDDYINDFEEYDKIDHIEKLIEELENNTTVWKLENGNILLIDFWGVFMQRIKIMAEIDEIIAEYRKAKNDIYNDKYLPESIKIDLIEKYEFFIGNLKMNQRRIIDSIED